MTTEAAHAGRLLAVRLHASGRDFAGLSRDHAETLAVAGVQREALAGEAAKHFIAGFLSAVSLLRAVS